jgi:hypothetical protein
MPDKGQVSVIKIFILEVQLIRKQYYMSYIIKYLKFPVYRMFGPIGITH